MVLIDTTVWIDFFAGSKAAHVELLKNCILQEIDLCICGVILTEVLQGIRHQKQYLEIKDLFNSFYYLEATKETYIDAADLYRFLRVRGITIRKTIDCLIAAVAIKNKIPLLHNDRDFEPLKKYCGLKVLDSD